MMHRLKSLRFRILLPVIVIILFIVTLQTSLFSRGYINMILQQEQEVNAVGFETVSRSMVPLIDTSISEVRSMMSDERVTSYARGQYTSTAERIRARIRCLDYLRAENASRDGIYGILFMRKDGSLFGTLPDANFFYDDPDQNPFPEDVKTRILNIPLGQTVWVGPLSGAVLYGFENDSTPKNIMIAAWKSVNVSYGECYALMLMDESIFGDLFATLQDGKSFWHLFTEDHTEIYHSGSEECMAPDLLISNSNSGEVFNDENGRPVCAFSMTMESPAWTLVREVSMESYERLIGGVRRSAAIFGGAVMLVALVAYILWLKKFMRQFRALQKGIVRMGEGDLEATVFEPTSIVEFGEMQRQINRTSQALSQQMDTIRRMERERMELENARKEQERITRELSMAREIQESSLPRVFPAFPDRTEFDLFASMTPAKEVGGDFYDFFLTDNNHLALVIADVSDKGIPAAMFMMRAKSLIKNHMLNENDPAQALAHTNLQLREGNTSMSFVTVWLAVVELSTGKGVACNAGHENPVLYRVGGKFEAQRHKHDMFAGVSKKAQYHNHEFCLRPGDCLFVYTDGVPEASNGAGERFSEKGLIDTLNRNPDADPETLIRSVHEAVNSFVGDAPQFDDLTMLCFKMRQ